MRFVDGWNFIEILKFNSWHDIKLNFSSSSSRLFDSSETSAKRISSNGLPIFLSVPVPVRFIGKNLQCSFWLQKFWGQGFKAPSPQTPYNDGLVIYPHKLHNRSREKNWRVPTSVSFYNFGDSSFTDSGFCWIRVDQLEEIHPRLDLRILNCGANYSMALGLSFEKLEIKGQVDNSLF